MDRRYSDGDLRASLAAARRHDRPPRPGAHAEPEAVLLVTAAVVRLVRALAHSRLQWGAAVNVLMSHRAPEPLREASCGRAAPPSMRLDRRTLRSAPPSGQTEHAYPQ